MKLFSAPSSAVSL